MTYGKKWTYAIHGRVNDLTACLTHVGACGWTDGQTEAKIRSLPARLTFANASRAGKVNLHAIDAADMTAAREQTRAPVGRPRGQGSRRVYEALRTRILSLDLRPGAELEANSTASEYEVSRTLVREAFLRLATEGLVQLLPNRSARVSLLELSEIPELIETLEVFGRITARWAADRRTEADIQRLREHQRAWYDAARSRDYAAMGAANNRFHQAVAQATGNRFLSRMYETLLPHYQRLSYTLYSRIPTDDDAYVSYYQRVNAEHEQITQSIVLRDVSASDANALAHSNQIREQLDYFMRRRALETVHLGSRYR